MRNLITSFFRRDRSHPERLPLKADHRTRNFNVIQWGNILLHESESTSHFIAIGTTGSGKTSLLRLLEQSVLWKVGAGDYRVVMYDAKGDLVPRIAKLVDPSRIFLLNPFDERCAAWDIAKDLDQPIKIKEFCFTLMPDRSDSQPFWAEAARDLMNGVMLAFYLSEVDYSLADVLRVMKNFRFLKRVLRQHPETHHLVSNYLIDKKLRRNLMATIASRIQIFEPVAASWERATQKISIKDFVHNDWVLVLGNSEVSTHVIQAINCALLKTITHESLHLPDSRSRRTWVFLDEVSEAGKFEGLVSLAKKGRSKGVCLVLGCQTISGLRDDKLYGTHGADEILGEIGNRFIGRLECTTSADYASQHIGDHMTWEASYGHSRTYSKENSLTYSVNHARQQRRRILPGQFLSLPKCNLINGIHGFCKVVSIGVYRFHIPGHELFHRMLIPPDENTPALIALDGHFQLLDYSVLPLAQRLGIDFQPPYVPEQPAMPPKELPLGPTSTAPFVEPSTPNSLECELDSSFKIDGFDPDPLG